MDQNDIKILKNQTEINRLVYRQKIADQESQSSSAKYAGYDATIGMSKVIDTEGNAKYVKSVTTGGVGKDSQIRVRSGESFGSYDAIPSRRVAQVEEVAEEAIIYYPVKTIFAIETDTTIEFYLGGDRTSKSISKIDPYTSFYWSPPNYNKEYTKARILNLGKNKLAAHIQTSPGDFEYTTLINNNNLVHLTDEPHYVYDEKAYLGNYLEGVNLWWDNEVRPIQKADEMFFLESECTREYEEVLDSFGKNTGFYESDFVMRTLRKDNTIEEVTLISSHELLEVEEFSVGYVFEYVDSGQQSARIFDTSFITLQAQVCEGENGVPPCYDVYLSRRRDYIAGYHETIFDIDELDITRTFNNVTTDSWTTHDVPGVPLVTNPRGATFPIVQPTVNNFDLTAMKDRAIAGNIPYNYFNAEELAPYHPFIKNGYFIGLPTGTTVSGSGGFEAITDEDGIGYDKLGFFWKKIFVDNLVEQSDRKPTDFNWYLTSYPGTANPNNYEISLNWTNADKTEYEVSVINNTFTGDPDNDYTSISIDWKVKGKYVELYKHLVNKTIKLRDTVEGKAVAMFTADGEIVQNYKAYLEYDIGYKIQYNEYYANRDLIEKIPVVIPVEEINTLTLYYEDTEILLNTGDFGVVNLDNPAVTVSSINSESIELTVTISKEELKYIKNLFVIDVNELTVTRQEFNLDSFAGEYLLATEIDNKEVLIKGEITSANYNSSSCVITLNCSITSFKNIPSSFPKKLILNNGSFYNYYFRKNIPLKSLPYNNQNDNREWFCYGGFWDVGNFDLLINKSILPITPLNPTYLSLWSSAYATPGFYTYEVFPEFAKHYTLNNLTDNIIKNKIFSVAKIDKNKAWVEQWSIEDNGDIKYNKVFTVDYVPLKKPNENNSETSIIFAHSYYP